MSPEQLYLRCRLRVEELFTPLTTRERAKLFSAAHKLLMFVLHDVSAQTFNDEERALQQALRPLIENGDCHFVAAVTSLVQFLLEERTDCPISGVFGAEKTLSAAAMIASLLVMDPTLKMMIVTKDMSNWKPGRADWARPIALISLTSSSACLLTWALLPLFSLGHNLTPSPKLPWCHRAPAGTTFPLYPSSMELHETPIHFYTRVLIHSLRLPFQLLGLPSDDILAIEEALKQALLPLPLPQAPDILHTQLLSCMCVSTPRRESSAPGPNQTPPPLACYLCPVDGSRTARFPPPVFRCWIGRKVSPNMAVLDFKCDSLLWAASYTKGTSDRSLFGLSPGYFLQLVFPTTDTFISDSPFGLSFYLTSVTTKGRVLEEHPEVFFSPMPCAP